MCDKFLTVSYDVDRVKFGWLDLMSVKEREGRRKERCVSIFINMKVGYLFEIKE